MFLISASSPEARQCPYIGKFTVTGLNHAQNSHKPQPQQQQHKLSSLDRVRHGQDRSEQERRSRRLELDIEKRRGNNQYFIHEHYTRKLRSENLELLQDAISRSKRSTNEEKTNKFSKSKATRA